MGNYLKVIDLGLIDYESARALQKQAVEDVLGGGEETLFLLEHTPVVTVGRNKGERSLLVSESYFSAQGIDFCRSERGGDVTAHFPGQLVAYPVMKLESKPGVIRSFFFDLEETIIRTLAGFGLKGERLENRPGVWTNGKKIASIGIAVRRFVTYHGIALNLTDDLKLFSLVNPCGMPDVRPTSVHLETNSRNHSMEELKHAFIANFEEVFAKTARVAENQAARR